VWTYSNAAVNGPIGALLETTSTSMIEVGEETLPFEVASTVDEFDDYGRPLETTLTLPESPTGTALMGDLLGEKNTISVGLIPVLVNCE
jgi:hypothetical protein